MNLHEYQAKHIFARYGITVPKGYVCTTQQEAEEATDKIGKGPWIVKCQVHAGGRGKSGGVKVLNTKKEIYAFMDYWLGKRLVTYQTDNCGQIVNKILIETVTEINREFYVGMVVDRTINSIVFMVSSEGGMEIENSTKNNINLIHKIPIDLLIGPQLFQGRKLAFKLGLIGDQINEFTQIFMALEKLFLDLDLSLLEVNPLVITKNGNLMCLDAKLSIDNNALFRQLDLAKMHDSSQEDAREVYAANWDLSYVALNGNIGCMVNGAGLAMGTMDMVKYYGGRPANFLDVGGTANVKRVTEAFKIILSDNSVKAVLINIFGGIVRCDLIADGIISAISEIEVKLPVVVRLEGNHAKLGVKKLINSSLNIIAETSLINAVKRVITVAEGIKCPF